MERPEKVTIKNTKQLREYQQTDKENAFNHFKEQEGAFKVLYLVPSIQLFKQTLRGCNNDTELTMISMDAISNSGVSRGTDCTSTFY